MSNSLNEIEQRQQGAAVGGAMSPHSKKVQSLSCSSGLFVCSLHALPVHMLVISGHTAFLPQCKEMLVR